GGNPCGNHCGTILLPKAFVEAKLFGAKRVAYQVSGQVKVVCAQPQRCPHHDFVEDCRRGVHQKMAPSRGADDAPKVACVHGHNRQGALLAQKTARSLGVLIPTGNAMSLSRKELSEQRAGGPGSEQEDAHRGGTLAQLVPSGFGYRATASGVGSGLPRPEPSTGFGAS